VKGADLAAILFASDAVSSVVEPEEFTTSQLQAVKRADAQALPREWRLADASLVPGGSS
jgi:hypothetical protein